MCVLAPILGVCVLHVDEEKGYKQRTARALSRPISTYVRYTRETIEISLVQLLFFFCYVFLLI